MSEKVPIDHFSNFPPSWWNERRKRDFFIDDNGLVKLRSGSETARNGGAQLSTMAKNYELLRDRKGTLH